MIKNHPSPTRAAPRIAIAAVVVILSSAVWVTFGPDSLPVLNPEAEIPLPFSSESSRLKGSLLHIGAKDGRTIQTVSFDEGEGQEGLPKDALNIVLIPDDTNISHGVPLQRVLTSGKRIFGYQYSSRTADAELDAKVRADQSEPLTFDKLFPGTFFASDEERDSSSFITSFEAQKNVTFLPLSEVFLKKNSRTVILTDGSGVLMTVRGLRCGDGVRAEPEECDDGNEVNTDTCDTSCKRVVTSGLQPLQDSFDVYVSPTPSNILAAYEAYGPTVGHLSLTGISDTDPPIQITADIEYEYPRAPHVRGDTASFVGRWVMKNVNVTSAVAPYQVPTLVPDSVSLNAWVASYVTIQTNGNPFMMHITIEGAASENVRPVLLPRFRSLPWVGHKRGIFLKGRTSDQLPNSSDDMENAPYGVDNANIHLKMGDIVERFEKMSNGLVTMDYRIEEARLQQIDSCNSTSITKALLENIGITASNYRASHEWMLGSLYQHAFDAAQETMGCSMSKEQGMASALTNCPHCGPGGWTHLVAEGMANAEHGFGHGLGFAHSLGGPRCGGESTYSPPVSIEQLFLHQADRGSTPNCRLGYNIPGASMTSAPHKPYFHVLDQESLGWLDGKQVTLAAQSGEYDVYSDNADMTSDRDKPRIIQIPVMREGEFDSVYIVLPPHRMILQNEVAFSEEYIAKINAGVLVYGGERNIRSGKSRMANELITLWYGSSASDNAIPVGGRVRLLWEGTDVTIEILERTEMRARVRITFGNE